MTEIRDVPGQTQQVPVVASVGDTLRVGAVVIGPTLAAGVIKRRPAMMALADRFQLDKPAIRLLQRLRRKYGAGPLSLRVPGRSMVLPLSGEQVGVLLEESPSPFSPATKEKKAALRHFQPHGVLISDGEPRAERRAFVDEVLEPGRPLHELAAPWARVIQEEARRALAAADLTGQLGWDTFNEAWWKVVRRVVFGSDGPAEREITDLLARLRLDGNWAYLHPQRKRLRARFDELLRQRLTATGPDSLAAKLVATPAGPNVDPAGQVPHWLFAFDAAGIATFRALALLATHPDQGNQARAEIADTDLGEPRQLEFHRACVLESVRLWPTTPALLRESRTDTGWGRAGTTFFVYTPLFHRDGETLPYADRFVPEIWLDGRAQDNPALVPFSAGPAKCPGRDLVLFSTATMLANLWQRGEFQLDPPGKLGPLTSIPATLDNFGLRFAVA